MRSNSLIASVHYGDYKGTAAADRHDQSELHELAEQHGIDTKRYFIIGARLHIGETRDTELGRGSVTLIATDTNVVRAYGVDAISRWVKENGGTLPYLEFTIETTLKAFLMAFKRFELVLVNSAIEGVREYEPTFD